MSEYKRPLFKELLVEQNRLMQVLSYLAGGLNLILVLPLYLNHIEGTEVIRVFMSLYTVVVLANAIVHSYHRIAFITYQVFIISSFFLVILYVLVSDGIKSPMIFLLTTFPAGAFSTSRKQGKIWSAIALITTFIIYKAEWFGIPVIKLIPDLYDNMNHLVFISSVIMLNATYAYLTKSGTQNLYSKYHYAFKDLEEKSNRLDYISSLVNYSPLLMCVIDVPTRTFIEVNPQFKIILGYELSETTGKNISMLFKESDLPPVLKDPLFKADELKRIQFRASTHFKNGEEKFFEWNGVVKEGKFFANASPLF